MKLDILSANKEKKSSMQLPAQFAEKVRSDIIKRAVEAEQSANRQAYGASPKAGLRHSTFVSKRRHNYKGTYGIGQSRTPRKTMSSSGTRFNFTGAFAPQTVGGRRAHPPKAEKIWEKRINAKEKALAMRSAIAATIHKELTQKRGHIAPESYPFIVDRSLESMKKTKEVKDFLATLGFDKDLERASVRKVRAGKGTMRGRKYKKRKGPLLVTAEDCDLLKAAKNIPGVDVVTVNELSAELLAPGAVPGRLTVWTDAAVEKIEKEKLFSK